MEEEEDEVDTWVVEEVVALVEVEAGEADEAVVEEVRFFDYFFCILASQIVLYFIDYMSHTNSFHSNLTMINRRTWRSRWHSKERWHLGIYGH